MAVWVSDLSKYYSEACRILRPGGLFMVNEYHPFRRIWSDSPGPLEMGFPYFERGPHEFDRAEDVPGAQAGSLPSYEFHWTVSDFATAMLDAGCELLAVHEIGDGRQAWELASLEGRLPEWLLLVGRKRGPAA